MKKIFLFITVVFFCCAIQAQVADSSALIRLNQQIDDYVVKRDTSALRNYYATDFVFTHGTGHVDSRNSWLQSVAKSNYISRVHDSVSAEIHNDIAILHGKLSVKRINKDKTESYFVRYVRVYILHRKQWEMISHYSTYEFHDPQ